MAHGPFLTLEFEHVGSFLTIVRLENLSILLEFPHLGKVNRVVESVHAVLEALNCGLLIKDD